MDVITTHTNADFDALASMVAAKKLYPDAVLVFPGSKDKSIRDFLLKSTLYFLEFEKSAKIKLEDITRLILVDIRQAKRIGKFAKLYKQKNVEIHIYDHHPVSGDDIKGTVELIKPYGSTTSILCELLQKKNIFLSPEESTVLMLGIYEDTGNLTFSSTTSEDFICASYLLKQGANLNIVSDFAIKEITSTQVSILNELLENYTIHSIHGIDIMITKASTEVFVDDFAVLVHKLKNMENVNVLFAIAAMDDRIFIVGRSRITDVNAGEILSEFGGGGHSSAASAAIHDLTLAQTEQKLIKVLNNKIIPKKIASAFMAAPVKTIDCNDTLKKASSLLTRYNINVLPVVKENKLKGLISRQIIEKAKFHGLKNSKVSDYMTNEFSTVTLNTDLNKIKNIIIDNNQRFLPVLSNKKLVGAITRTDLLRALHLDSASDDMQTEIISQHARKKRMKSILSERLPHDLLFILKDAGKTADKLGCKLYAVGGFVRDIFLHFINYDIDIVVEGDGIHFAKIFAKKHGCKVKIYKQFGTAVIDFDDGLKIDIASSRLEYYEKPAALPRVEWSSIKLDLYRRDFIINTLAVQLNASSFGDLTDFFGARRDIKEKTIRVLHNLSFVEDPSRIFRAIRFEQRFNFHLSKLTKSLIENAVKMEFLNNLGGKRLFTELIILLKEDNVDSIINRLNDFNLLKFFHPSIVYDTNLRSMINNIQDVLSWYDLLYLENKYEKWMVYLLALLDSLKIDDVEKNVKYFDLKNKLANPIRIAKGSGNDVLSKLSKKRTIKNSDIYKLLKDIPVEVCLYLMAKTNRQVTKKSFSNYISKLQNIKLHVKGNDLKKLGILPGQIYKEIFDSVFDAVLNEKVSGKEEEIKFIKKKYRLSN